MTNKTVLVTGANGYLGRAVCHIFSLSGWTVYGLVRSQEKATGLALDEITPIIGSSSDLSFLSDKLQDTVFDVIVSTTEDLGNYTPHFESILELVKAVSGTAKKHGKKPLLLFTSGSKDTGESGLEGSPDFVVHDETTPDNNQVKIIAPRTENAPRVFNYQDQFHGVVIRPTPLYGHSGSFYGQLFHSFTTNQPGQSIVIYGDPKTVWHGVHVDDCARAYELLASQFYQCSEKVHGQIFLIGNEKWDTVGDIVEGLRKVYGERKVEWMTPDPNNQFQTLMAHSQAICADKMRALGWTTKKPALVDSIDVYVAAWEEAMRMEDARAKKMLEMVNLVLKE
ncbi:MAG: hypothetical protein M1834_002155 [Cirrosporium novae-zelandiae]|nr:MAG: hypothetical protein M1834_002155 [Cirrosporium novae-zelandiae]